MSLFPRLDGEKSTHTRDSGQKHKRFKRRGGEKVKVKVKVKVKADKEEKAVSFRSRLEYVSMNTDAQPLPATYNIAVI